MLELPLIDNSNSNFLRSRFSTFIQRRKLGSVKITENNICVKYKKNTIHYYFSDVDYLEIHGSLYWDYNPSMIYLVEELAKRKYTGKTKLELKFKDQNVVISFRIISEQDFISFNSLLTKWYQKGTFKIKEYHLGEERMLLLNPFHSYEIIQGIKKKLGIKSMYE